MASSYALAVAAAAAAAGGGAVAEEAGEAAEEALTRGMVGQTGVVVRMIAGTESSPAYYIAEVADNGPAKASGVLAGQVARLECVLEYA